MRRERALPRWASSALTTSLSCSVLIAKFFQLRGSRAMTGRGSGDMRTAAPPSAASACCATCSSKISPRASRRLRRRPATADSRGASSGGGRARALPSPLIAKFFPTRLPGPSVVGPQACASRTYCQRTRMHGKAARPGKTIGFLSRENYYFPRPQSLSILPNSTSPFTLRASLKAFGQSPADQTLLRPITDHEP